MANDIYIKYLPAVDSTNSYLRYGREALQAEAGGARIIAVYAGEQSAGRGQRGNVWHSEKDENLLMSLLVHPHFLPVKNQFLLSQAVALAVNATMHAYGVESVIKWPNDIYVGSRKVAGVLVELDYGGEAVESAVIGVGVNVNQTEFPAMDKVPVSVSLLTGRSYDIEEVLGLLLSSFVHYYDMLENGEAARLVEEYKSNLMGYGCTMRYKDAVSAFDAVVKDVQGDGALCLEKVGSGLSLYYFKEVELVL